MNRSKNIGTKAEKNISQKLNMKLTPGSGSGNRKGDLYNDECVLESKATTKMSIGLKYEWLRKLVQQAPLGKDILLYLTFMDTDSSIRFYGEWVCMPAKQFEQIKEGQNLQE